MIELFGSDQCGYGADRSFDPAKQCDDHLCARFGRSQCCGLVHGRLYSGNPVGPCLHDRRSCGGKEENYRSTVKLNGKERWDCFIKAVPALLLIIVVIGGIIAGVFTATEGSAVAVVYSLILSFIYKTICVKDLPQIFVESAEMTGIIIFLIGVSSIMSWVMAFTGIPQLVSGALLSITDNRYVLFLLINVILLIVGTFMDMTPAILIFTPIFMPVCLELGMNMIHFGIMMIYNLCIGTITPPVGTTLFVGVKVGKVTIESVFRYLLPFFGVIIVVLMFVTYIPQLSLFLPGLMGLI